jgi:NOL1/NOP2/sun family putative RNA methylase
VKVQPTGQSAAEIPEPYLAKMQQLLGEEYPAFRDSLSAPSIASLRVNTLKIAPLAIQSVFPLDLIPVPWCPSGFWLKPSTEYNISGISPGKHPYHAAGLYYLQEPSAMAVVEILDPQPGEHVLDLAAAPGGKSTHILAKMDECGLLFSNEIHSQRVWELAENLERWGAHNVVVLNETPKRLAAHFMGYFDRILLDAPCSGEGMFRKSENARRDWSPGLVQSCALRQTAILAEAVRMLRPGGILVYSTCTFSPEENEGVIAALLRKHPDFELESVESYPGFSTGQPKWGGGLPALSAAVRIYPHHAVADGHFIARLRRSGSPAHNPLKHTKTSQPSHQSIEAVRLFFQESLRPTVDFGNLHLSGSYLYHLPTDIPDLKSLKVIHPGLWLGVLKQGKRSGVMRFEPAHALALALRPGKVQQVIDLDLPQARRYLSGEALTSPGGDGWILVTVDGYSLGWGKRAQGVIKNYYPKGLRWV